MIHFSLSLSLSLFLAFFELDWRLIVADDTLISDIIYDTWYMYIENTIHETRVDIKTI